MIDTKTGDHVVCVVNDFIFPKEYKNVENYKKFVYPKLGHVYTILHMVSEATSQTHGEEELFYILKEISNPHPITGYPMLFHWDSFEPVDPMALEIFRNYSAPIKDTEFDNDTEENRIKLYQRYQQANTSL